MSVHRYHPDPEREDPEDAVLYDDCERCAEHAEALFTLDRDNIQLLWKRMLEHELGDAGGYRTRNEAIACERLFLSGLVVSRALGLDEIRDLL